MVAINLGLTLDKIIDKGTITALFQPIFNIESQTVHGFEALSRGPEHGPLHAPVPLFQTAEHEGRLSELETICRRVSIEQFYERGLDGKLFINISPKALLDPEHPKGLTIALLQRLGIPPSQVVIELSEQHPADDIDLLKSCLSHYRNQGFLTAIDDLGTGYSGLRLWSELAPDYIKIDRHFVHQIDKYAVKQEFVRSIVELCQSLTCKVIAEGIETESELAILKQLNITYCQGYYLGYPEKNPKAKLNLQPSERPIQQLTRYNESVESLCTNATPVAPQTKLKDLSELFIRDTSLQAIAIVHHTRPQGLISRHYLMELFSTPYGRALHENHQVEEVMDRNVMRFEASEPLSNVSQQLTADSDNRVAQQFIIMRQGHFLGIGHTKDLLQRITEHRIKTARHANPLTGLPGNVPIQEELKRLQLHHRSFYLAYFDLCDFKPYNDVYGFCRGDEVIRELGNQLHRLQSKDTFIGHIGGDDFVVISTGAQILEQCQHILTQFEQGKAAFYNEQHWQTQKIRAQDRNGVPCVQPLLSLCVGVLPPQLTAAGNEHSLSQLSAKAKKKAKHSSPKLCLLESSLKPLQHRLE